MALGLFPMKLVQMYSIPNVRCGIVWHEKGRPVRCQRRARAYRCGMYVLTLGLIFVCPQHFKATALPGVVR